MWDVKACRSCLATDCKLERISDVYKRIYATITGLEICSGDGYPSYFCMECSMQIKKTLAFRRKCRRAFFVLKEIMTVKKQVTLSDIKIVDRKKTNLTTPYAASTRIVTDIKPDNYEEIEREEEEKRLEEMNQDEMDQTAEQEETFNDDGIDMNNIDLDDVFKDLKVDEIDEDEEDDSEELKVDKNTVPENSLGKKRRARSTREKEELRTKARALTHCKVRLLSEDEQALTFKQRLKMESFLSAPYKCSMCLTTYEDLPTLIAHVELHNSNISNAYPCGVCKNRFASQEALHQHRADFHMYEFKCGGCNALAYTIEDLVDCYNKHGGPPPPKEVKAKDPFGDVDKFFVIKPLPHEDMYRTLSKHSGGKRYVCHLCKIGFTGARALRSHMAMHVDASKDNKYMYNCDVCGLAAASRAALSEHVRAWHLYGYTCTLCGDVCMNRLQASCHIKHHINDKTLPAPLRKKFACQYCSKSYACYSALAAHRAQAHADRAARHCPLCGFSYGSQYGLYRHQLAEHGCISINDPAIGDPQYRCAPCNVQFVDQTSYHTHIVRKGHKESKDIELACNSHRLVFKTNEEKLAHNKVCIYKHERNYPVTCHYCDVTLHNGKEYKRHHARRHGDQQYRSITAQRLCECCGKTVLYQSLKTHMRSHAKVPTELSCPQCAASLAGAAPLVAHILSRHAPRPYRCALCPARYSHRCECKDHILKVHAPEQPFACAAGAGACARRFSHVDYMRAHARKAHHMHFNKLKKNKQMQGKIYLYPFMKLDASGLDLNILQKANLEICDFNDQNIKVIPVEDYNEYLIFDKQLPRGGVKRKLAVEMSPDGKKSKRDENDDRNFLIKPKLEFKDEELSGAEGEKEIKRSISRKALQSIPVDRKYECEFCGMLMPSATSCAVHLLYNHTRFPYRCALCPSKFKYKCDCRDHILKIHAPVTPYACKYCPEQFAHRDALDGHSLKTHGMAQKPSAPPRPRSMKGKLFVYPHMKLDVKCISDDVLEKMELLVCDYLDDSAKVADDYRYYAISSSDDPIPSRNNKLMEAEKTVMKRNQKTKRNVGRSRVSLDTEEDESSEDTFDQHIKLEKSIQDRVKETTVNKQTVDEDGETDETIQKSMPDLHVDYDEETVEELTIEEAVDDDTEVHKMINLDGEHYEIIEKDGEQYVMINDMLYRIESNE